MNALELADKLEQKALTADAMEYGFEVDFEEAATMLRNQQAEINALKKEAALQRLSDFTQEAECKHGVDDGACKECYQEATEPAAWMDEDENVVFEKCKVYPIPLYTHPHPDNLGLAESIIKQQKLEIDALHNLVKEQDKKIIDLAFEKVYAEKSAEVLSELYTHPVKEQDESFDRTASHMAREYVSWTSCVACGQRVTGDSIHTCSPQLKELTDEEILSVLGDPTECNFLDVDGWEIHNVEWVDFARAILRKAQEK